MKNLDQLTEKQFEEYQLIPFCKIREYKKWKKALNELMKKWQEGK